MKLTLDSAGMVHRIRAYAPGEVLIGDVTYRRSLVVSADRLVPDWRPRRFDELTADDIDLPASLNPELVILGCGATQRFFEPSVLAPLIRRGVGVEIMETGAACRTFNILLAEDRPVVAALIIE